MSWNLKGSYAETCSCELMCPCNLSFDHGATYDYCRVTLVFDIREGEVDGTDVSGLKVAAIADTPKVMTEGNWRLGVFIDAERDGRAGRQAHGRLRRAARRPDGGARPARRRDARCRARADRGASTTDTVTASASATSSTSRSRTSSRSASRPASRSARRDVPPGRLRVSPRRGEALADRRVRHRVRGQDGALDIRVLVGRLTA